MSDSTRAALAASVAAGYLLGRSRRTKLAVAVATYLASGRLRAKPQELLAAGAGKLGESPQLSQLTEQVRTELLTVGRQALKAAFDQRLGTFADSLAERTKSLGQTMDSLAEEARDEETDEQTDEEPEEGEEERGEAERDEERGDGEGRTSAKQRRKSTGSRRESTDSSSSQQKAAKRPAKKAPPKKAARRTTQKSTEPSRRRR
ncbi:hypothetical protein [Streptomyces albidus (ex Kaewkla and Franco 2022)]|uniref:hypothetical protein n=1 Tax=Streptomyces albidus (ex Kaewkla and Franco 2022) TaxID=722709 RepID=UPI0015EE6EB0|nr:hypothetical protein [Streptomyces albidus (ex Kaewkla and Franco 2022)]